MAIGGFQVRARKVSQCGVNAVAAGPGRNSAMARRQWHWPAAAAVDAPDVAAALITNSRLPHQQSVLDRGRHPRRFLIKTTPPLPVPRTFPDKLNSHVSLHHGLAFNVHVLATVHYLAAIPIIPITFKHRRFYSRIAVMTFAAVRTHCQRILHYIVWKTSA